MEKILEAPDLTYQSAEVTVGELPVAVQRAVGVVASQAAEAKGPYDDPNPANAAAFGSSKD